MKKSTKKTIWLIIIDLILGLLVWFVALFFECLAKTK